MKKKNLIFRIIFLTIFLIVSTIFVYLPKRDEFAGAMAFLTTMDNISIEQVTDGIILSNLYPVNDEIGLTSDETIFKVKNYNNKKVKYQIKIESYEKYENIKYMDITNLRYSYKMNNGKYSNPKNINSDGVLDISSIDKNSINTYYFKFWIDENLDESLHGSHISCAISLDKID